MKFIIIILVAISITFFLYYENNIKNENTNKQIKTENKKEKKKYTENKNKKINNTKVTQDIKEVNKHLGLEDFLINDNKKINEHNILTIKNNQEKTYYKSQSKSIKYDGFNVKSYDEDIHKNKELKRQLGVISFSNEKNYKNDIRNYEYIEK